MMKKIIKANTNINNDISFAEKCVFSLQDFVNILNEFEELNGLDISLEEKNDNSCVLVIGKDECTITYT